MARRRLATAAAALLLPASHAVVLATRREPALLERITGAGWRLAEARAALPRVQVARGERTVPGGAR